MRLIVSGGGSAGHITPVLAVLQTLKRHDPELEVAWVGLASGMEAKLVQSAKIDFFAIKSGKFRRVHGQHIVRQLFNPQTIGSNLVDISRVIIGTYQSFKIIRRFQPDVIFIKGGYVGLPLGLAAGFMRVPYLIHESDLSAGLANRVLAKRAARICVGFPISNYPQWPSNRLVFTGNPVRSELLGIDQGGC